MTTENKPSITLPTLAEGAVLRLMDPKPNDDATFATKKGRPVDAVCVDCAAVASGNGKPAVRLLFVVLSGQDENDNDVTGRNVVCDKYISAGAAPYTLADLRLMGWNVVDGQEQEALGPIADGDIVKSGLGSKVVRLDLKHGNFNNNARIELAGISLPPAKLSAAAIKTQFGAGLVDAIKKSKEGRPAFDKSAGGAAGGASQPRNPTSPPPAVQGGPVKIDSEIPF